MKFPRRALVSAVPVVLIGWCALVGAPAPGAPNKPNIVFVLADDLGWSELGCYGNGFNETPHLDQLARDGMRYTDAYGPLETH